MPNLPKTKEEISAEATQIIRSATSSEENMLRMAKLFLEVLTDIRDNLEIPHMSEGDITE